MITGKRAASTKAGVCGYAALSADLQGPKTDRLIISGAIKFNSKVEIVSFTSFFALSKPGMAAHNAPPKNPNNIRTGINITFGKP